MSALCRCGHGHPGETCEDHVASCIDGIKYTLPVMDPLERAEYRERIRRARRLLKRGDPRAAADALGMVRSAGQ